MPGSKGYRKALGCCLKWEKYFEKEEEVKKMEEEKEEEEKKEKEAAISI